MTDDDQLCPFGHGPKNGVDDVGGTSDSTGSPPLIVRAVLPIDTSQLCGDNACTNQLASLPPDSKDRTIFVVIEQNFVARFQLDIGCDNIHGNRGVVDERHVTGFCTDESGQYVDRTIQSWFHLSEIEIHRLTLESPGPFFAAFLNDTGCRPEGTMIQIGHVLGDGPGRSWGWYKVQRCLLSMGIYSCE